MNCIIIWCFAYDRAVQLYIKTPSFIGPRVLSRCSRGCEKCRLSPRRIQYSTDDIFPRSLRYFHTRSKVSFSITLHSCACGKNKVDNLTGYQIVDRVPPFPCLHLLRVMQLHCNYYSDDIPAANNDIKMVITNNVIIV